MRSGAILEIGPLLGSVGIGFGRGAVHLDTTPTGVHLGSPKQVNQVIMFQAQELLNVPLPLPFNVVRCYRIA